LASDSLSGDSIIGVRASRYLLTSRYGRDSDSEKEGGRKKGGGRWMEQQGRGGEGPETGKESQEKEDVKRQQMLAQRSEQPRF
jgi:hypothetical protein